MEQNINLSELNLAQLSNLYWQLKDSSPIKGMVLSQIVATQRINYEESQRLSAMELYANSVKKSKLTTK